MRQREEDGAWWHAEMRKAKDAEQRAGERLREAATGEHEWQQRCDNERREKDNALWERDVAARNNTQGRDRTCARHAEELRALKEQLHHSREERARLADKLAGDDAVGGWCRVLATLRVQQRGIVVCVPQQYDRGGATQAGGAGDPDSTHHDLRCTQSQLSHCHVCWVASSGMSCVSGCK